MINPVRFNTRMSHTQYTTKLRYLLLPAICMTYSVTICSPFLFHIISLGKIY